MHLQLLDGGACLKKMKRRHLILLVVVIYFYYILANILGVVIPLLNQQEPVNRKTKGNKKEVPALPLPPTLTEIKARSVGDTIVSPEMIYQEMGSKAIILVISYCNADMTWIPNYITNYGNDTYIIVELGNEDRTEV